VPDQTLLLLLDEVRGKTLLILDATPAELGVTRRPLTLTPFADKELWR
jgi:hypothetical protein